MSSTPRSPPASPLRSLSTRPHASPSASLRTTGSNPNCRYNRIAATRSAPDAVARIADGIVGSWEGTRWLWRCWRPALAARGLPAAIVLQDGATPESVPWDELRAVFVGASTRWKLSRSAELLVCMARARGLWVHVGRVNTMNRLARVEAMGADSFDGGQFSRWPDTYIPPFLSRLEVRQHTLTELLRPQA